MPINYRPADITPRSSGGDLGPGGSGTTELSHAGLSANLEHQLAAPGDVAQAHRFFTPRLDSAVVSPPALAPGGAEAAAFSAVPGADASALAGIPAGGETVSPLIQLIMKLPGLGAITSFFDALAAFFMPGGALLGGFDLASFAQHAGSAATAIGASLGEHIPISLSLLPSNAPIFQTLGHQGLQNFGMLSGKMGTSLSEHGLGSFSRDALNISGKLDIHKAQFEGGTAMARAGAAGKLGAASHEGIASGPAISESGLQSHIAGNQRLFSDRIGSASMNSLTSNSGSAASSAVGVSQTVPLSGSSWPSSIMNVGASGFGQEVSRLPAVANVKDGIVSGPGLSDNAGFHMGSSSGTSLDGIPKLGPSGAVSDKLGGQQLIASEPLPTYRPTLGGLNKTFSSDYSAGSAATGQSTFSSATTTTSPASAAPQSLSKNMPAPGSAMEGLKAKQLTLKGFKGSNAAQSKPVMDHIGHQTKSHGSHPASAGGKTMDNIAHRSTPRSASHHVQSPRSGAAGAAGSRPVDRAPASQPLDPPAENLAQAPSDTVGAGADSLQGSTYTVQSGDCLWNIARDRLGSGLRWQEIYKLNSDILGSNPDLIHTGTTIRLPGAGSEMASAGSEAGTYVVQPGDNLWDIASRQLGAGERWGELYNANAGVVGANPRLIFPGQELSIPGGPGTQVASAPSPVDPSSMQAPALPPAAQPVPATAAAPPAAEAPAAAEAPPTGTEAIPQAQPVSWQSPAAHEVMPAESAAAPAPGPGAASAAPLGQSPAQKSVVSSSLRPDLSFLLNSKGKSN